MTELANSITRMSLADHFDACDESIKDFNDTKREGFTSYRAQLENMGWPKDAIKAEIEAVKAAIKRRRLVTKDEAAVEAKDALVEEVLAEITARAPRATRVATSVPNRDERRRDRFSESMDDAKALSAEAAALGLINPEAHAETARIADALAAKFGNGPIQTPHGDGDIADAASGDGPCMGADIAADEAEPTQVEASSVPRKRQWKHSDPAHPDCLDPGQCGGFSNLGLCQRCKDAAA